MGGWSQDYKSGSEELKWWSLNSTDNIPEASIPTLGHKNILNMDAIKYTIDPWLEILEDGHNDIYRGSMLLNR